jgi:hypothetical protein
VGVGSKFTFRFELGITETSPVEAARKTNIEVPVPKKDS